VVTASLGQAPQIADALRPLQACRRLAAGSLGLTGIACRITTKLAPARQGLDGGPSPGVPGAGRGFPARLMPGCHPQQEGRGELARQPPHFMGASRTATASQPGGPRARAASVTVALRGSPTASFICISKAIGLAQAPCSTVSGSRVGAGNRRVAASSGQRPPPGRRQCPGCRRQACTVISSPLPGGRCHSPRPWWLRIVRGILQIQKHPQAAAAQLMTSAGPQGR